MLNVVLIFLRTNPLRPRSEVREILSVDLVVLVKRPHDEEIVCLLVRGNVEMRKLVKVIVDDLSNVENASLLVLGLRSQVKLDSRSVHIPQIPNVVLAI